MPVTLTGAGLPQLRSQLGRVRSYAERLFEFTELGPLSEDEAKDAVQRPLRRHGVGIGSEALQLIVDRTEGYPYFLQEWGQHTWNSAVRSPIDEADVRAAEVHVAASLDAGFFRVRYDRLTPAERRYMRAMASLGPGPHRSGDVAQALGRKVKSLAPVREADRQGDDLESESWCHGLHRSVVRRLHAADDARRRPGAG